MEISRYLRQHSRTIAGKSQLFINSYAKALEVGMLQTNLVDCFIISMLLHYFILPKDLFDKLWSTRHGFHLRRRNGKQNFSQPFPCWRPCSLWRRGDPLVRGKQKKHCFTLFIAREGWLPTRFFTSSPRPRCRFPPSMAVMLLVSKQGTSVCVKRSVFPL